MLSLYQWLMARSERTLNALLNRRLKAGKEHAQRIDERRGLYTKARPEGALIWLHAASVGEAQSALILINAITQQNPQTHILVTTGTQTSAKHMAGTLPDQAFHQFMPLDHPQWTQRFLEHWTPDMALWMESELWPNMLSALKASEIPSILINARLSDRSFKRWFLFPSSARDVLGAFNLILAQSDQDKQRFENLGAAQVRVSGNLKHSAAPLPHDEDTLQTLAAYCAGRPIITYASTHQGEEAIAMRTHQLLQNIAPDLLSIIIPRHPERGESIEALGNTMHLKTTRRSNDAAYPEANTQIYIADTLGELGLFYRLSPIVFIGRSLSDDGGGGHNPIEAAQLNCAILHGSNIQNLRDIYDDISAQDAALSVRDEAALIDALRDLLQNADKSAAMAARALQFSKSQSNVVLTVLNALSPYLADMELPPNARKDRST